MVQDRLKALDLFEAFGILSAGDPESETGTPEIPH
jgi:hypothetical protein